MLRTHPGDVDAVGLDAGGEVEGECPDEGADLDRQAREEVELC